MAGEVREAIRAGIPIEGVCLYPVLSHPGWSNGRMCPNGLLEMQPRHGCRPVHEPLAAELRRQQALNDAFFQSGDFSLIPNFTSRGWRLHPRDSRR